MLANYPRTVSNQRAEGQSFNERGTPTVSKRCPATARSARAAECIGERQDFGGHAAFRAANRLALGSPFCAPWPWALGLDEGGVDHGVFQVGIVEDGVEQPLPDIRLHPVAEPREHAVPVAERGRADHTPRAAGSGDPQHRLDKLSIVLAAAAGIARLAKTKRHASSPIGGQSERSGPSEA
jgi:hypothetical protein